MKKSWPKTVPILEPSDICKGMYDDGKGRHCLIGWVRAVFPMPLEDVVREELIAVVRDSKLMTWNDTNKSRKVAAAWNVAIRNLGYTEVVSR